MCTAFVKKGYDVIVGFNMDIHIGAFAYEVFKEPDMFYIGIIVNHDGSEFAQRIEFPHGYGDGTYMVRKAHGVNNKGSFGNMLNNMNFLKAKFRTGKKCLHA